MALSKITTKGILDGTIATADLADNAVNSAKIGADVITDADIANNAVTVNEIANNAVTAAKLHGDVALGAGYYIGKDGKNFIDWTKRFNVLYIFYRDQQIEIWGEHMESIHHAIHFIIDKIKNLNEKRLQVVPIYIDRLEELTPHPIYFI